MFISIKTANTHIITPLPPKKKKCKPCFSRPRKSTSRTNTVLQSLQHVCNTHSPSAARAALRNSGLDRPAFSWLLRKRTTKQTKKERYGKIKSFIDLPRSYLTAKTITIQSNLIPIQADVWRRWVWGRGRSFLGGGGIDATLQKGAEASRPCVLESQSHLSVCLDVCPCHRPRGRGEGGVTTCSVISRSST